MIVHVRAATALAIWVASATIAGAQQPPSLNDLTLEQLMRTEIAPVFGASQRLQPVTEAPAAVSIVTADEIARYGYRSLADVLGGVRGLFTYYDRNYSYVGARGFAQPGDYNTRILVLVNGHRMNDNIYDQAALGPELGLDPATFERVEIVRGPASSLYGTSAFLAIVNVITRSGASLGSPSVSVETGTFGERRVHAASGRRLANGVDVAMAGTVSHADGPRHLYFPAFDTPETHGGIADAADSEDIRQLFARVAFKSLSVTGAYGHRGKQVPTASFGTVFNDPRLRTVDAHAFADGEYTGALLGAAVTLRAFVDRYDYSGRYPYPPADASAATVLNDDYARGIWWGAEGRLTRSLPWRQTLVAGVEFRDNVRQEQGAYDVDPYRLTFASSESSHVNAVYAQDEIKLHRRLMVDLGARYDAYGSFGRLSPRGGVIFTPSSHESFKYLYGAAFRAPNAYERDYYSNGVPNLSLRPELVSTHEIVWEHYSSHWLRTSLSAYTNDADNLLTLTTDAVDHLTFVNRGAIDAQGIEAEAEVRLERGLQGLASYALQRAKDPATSSSLVNSPARLAKFRITIPGWLPRSFASAELHYVSNRKTLAGSSVAAATVANLTLGAPLGPNCDLVGSIRNLFNQRYADPASEEHRQDWIEQDGRTLRVGIRWTFRTR